MGMDNKQPEMFSFIRYLAAKKSVDDRALNQHVWQNLVNSLPAIIQPGKPLKILEIGAGIGTMVERVLNWKIACNVEYTGLDISKDHLTEAKKRLLSYAVDNDFKSELSTDDLSLSKGDCNYKIKFERADLYEFLKEGHGMWAFDILIAHAFLDLLNLPDVLPHIFTLLKTSGLFYFTGNYDGSIIFEPAIDPRLDAKVEALYYRAMDERITYGRISGDKHTGRHLYNLFRQVGAVLIDSGSSDWVVFANDKGYHEDEAYFLHFIVNSVEKTLLGSPEINSIELQDWIKERHAQIRRGELTFIAHQLDFLGTWK
jgi:SAM-dependent methyltransferase